MHTDTRRRMLNSSAAFYVHTVIFLGLESLSPPILVPCWQLFKIQKYSWHSIDCFQNLAHKPTALRTSVSLGGLAWFLDMCYWEVLAVWWSLSCVDSLHLTEDKYCWKLDFYGGRLADVHGRTQMHADARRRMQMNMNADEYRHTQTNGDARRRTQGKLCPVCGRTQPQDVSRCKTFVQGLSGRTIVDTCKVCSNYVMGNVTALW